MMASEKKENFSYLDGVPIRIGQKFLPPRNIALPLAFYPQLPSDLLSEEYDFSLEKQVLELARKQNKVSEDKAKAKDDKIATDIENFTKAIPADIVKKDAPPVVFESDSVAKSPPVSIWQSNSILQPKPQVHHKPVENGPISIMDKSKKFNLSDFENDSSSPFDYMELQTINDLEELNTVFQGLCGSKSPPSAKPTEINRDTNYSALAKDSSQSSSAFTSEIQEQTRGNSYFSKSISFPSPQHMNFTNSEEFYTSKTTGEPSFINTSKVTQATNKSFDHRLSCSYPSVSGLVNELSTTRDMHSKPTSLLSDKNRYSYSALPQVPQTVQYFSPATRQSTLAYSSELSFSPSKTCGRLRTSKSVSDLQNLSLGSYDDLSQRERSHTPPPNLYAGKVSVNTIENIFTKNVLCENASEEDYSSRNGLLCSKASSSSDSSPGFPDPYDELSNLEKQFVDSITDMGFSRSLVARTVKHLGTDDKKVVEHLCQIQMLEEAGYESLEAEAALHLHDYNKDEAKKFLDLLNQFQDLGFEKTAIKKALVQHKNDRDRVIDALLP